MCVGTESFRFKNRFHLLAAECVTTELSESGHQEEEEEEEGDEASDEPHTEVVTIHLSSGDLLSDQLPSAVPEAFQCDLDGCGRVFNRGRKLRVHLMSHTACRPFKVRPIIARRLRPIPTYTNSTLRCCAAAVGTAHMQTLCLHVRSADGTCGQTPERLTSRHRRERTLRQKEERLL